MFCDHERNPIQRQGRDRNITDTIFHCCLNGQSLAGLARKWGERHPDKPTTAQNITNKIARDSIKLREFAEYLDIMGFDLLIVPKGETITPPEKHETSEEETNTSRTIKDMRKTVRAEIISSVLQVLMNALSEK